MLKIPCTCGLEKLDEISTPMTEKLLRVSHL
jgi:hypothetical protein